MVIDKKERVYINNGIKAFKVLLLDENGDKLGIFSRGEALEKAQSAGLDLVQVGYNSKDKISICKILDYGKYQYQLKKKEKDKKKNQKSKGFKEIKLSYVIGENDLNLKIEKAKKLLQKGYNVRFTLRLRGRENVFKEQSKEKMQYIDDQLKDYGKSTGIKEEGKGLSMVLFAKFK